MTRAGAHAYFPALAETGIMLWGSWKVLWLLVYCKYFVANLYIWDSCIAFAMLLTFYLINAMFLGDTKIACCWPKFSLVIVGMSICFSFFSYVYIFVYRVDISFLCSMTIDLK